MAKKGRFVAIRTYGTEIDASMAGAFLESRGINFIIVKDDVGGMQPNFQLTSGVKLLVSEQEEKRATELLDSVQS